MKKAAKVVLPLLVLILAVWGAKAILDSRPEAKKKPRKKPAPLVRVVPALPVDYCLTVSTHGTVRPRTETSLVAEVAGKVVHVSQALAAGGFFEKGEVLVRIDKRDYELALVQARGQLAKGRLALAQMEAEAGVAKKEWKRLGTGQATGLAMKEPHMAEARAQVASAQAALDQARLDLGRCEITAPFAGRVRTESVDVGQYLAKGTKLAEIYAVDYAEVRLPLPDEELAFLDLPLAYRGNGGAKKLPKVRLSAKFAGKVYHWEGEIVRTEGEIDPKTRMVYAVAQVKDPYGKGKNPGRPPLAAGLFVEAMITGNNCNDVVVLPRSSLRNQDEVLVVDKNRKIHFRKVKILRLEGERAVVSSGLKEGELVCVSPPVEAVEGMSVRLPGEAMAGAKGDGNGPGGKEKRKKSKAE